MPSTEHDTDDREPPNALHVTGHGGRGLVADACRESASGEVRSGATENVDGLRALCSKEFPGGIPSRQDEGATTTPFDMAALDDPDRFHPVVDRAPTPPVVTASSRRRVSDVRRAAPREHGDPAITGWTWS